MQITGGVNENMIQRMDAPGYACAGRGAPAGVFVLSVHIWTFLISEYYGQTMQALDYAPNKLWKLKLQ